MAVSTETKAKFDVGGVLLDRPFKIRRLGHFGYNVVNMEDAFHFYTDLLGFRVSDVNDHGAALSPEQRAGLGDTNGYFMRYGGDHHAFVLYNKRVRDLLDASRRTAPGVTINQISWQVGSLAEVVNGHRWLVEQGLRIRRSGRDMPGSNWHTYLYDPDGHVNELFYGMEQVGWDGYSKPKAMHVREFREIPALPQIAEADEVEQALAQGVELHSGYRYRERQPAKYDVDGILLPRPFKIVRLGPVRLFVGDVAAAQHFYEAVLGFILTEEVVWEGHRCVFLRANTEHHSVALYPIAVREALGLSAHSTAMALGLQVATYRQLRDAVAFLQAEGVQVRELPPELFPGLEYSAFAFDPDGHGLQLYSSMEQIGWDGRPRPCEQRRQIQVGNWPEVLEASADAYMGEPYLGPWG